MPIPSIPPTKLLLVFGSNRDRHLLHSFYANMCPKMSLKVGDRYDADNLNMLGCVCPCCRGIMIESAYYPGLEPNNQDYETFYKCLRCEHEFGCGYNDTPTLIMFKSRSNAILVGEMSGVCRNEHDARNVNVNEQQVEAIFAKNLWYMLPNPHVRMSKKQYEEYCERFVEN